MNKKLRETGFYRVVEKGGAVSVAWYGPVGDPEYPDYHWLSCGDAHYRNDDHFQEIGRKLEIETA